MNEIQVIRLADVFIIAPILIYASVKIGITKPLGIAVLLIGFGTLVYNGTNFAKEMK